MIHEACTMVEVMDSEIQDYAYGAMGANGFGDKLYAAGLYSLHATVHVSDV